MARVAKTTKKVKEAAVEVASLPMNTKYLVKDDVNANINNVLFQFKKGEIVEIDNSTAFFLRFYLEQQHGN